MAVEHTCNEYIALINYVFKILEKDTHQRNTPLINGDDLLGRISSVNHRNTNSIIELTHPIDSDSVQTVLGNKNQ